MGPQIRIVQASADDLPAIARLFDAYRVFYRQTSDLEAARRFIAERFKRRDSVIFLALADDEAAGFAQLYPSLSSVSMRPIWILNDLFVNPAHRGQGVGRRLMDRSRDFARASGAIRIELTTERTNATAQSLYRAAGYARDDVFYKFILTVETQA
ncbi:MAG TPA: GNAT family N-acetyltransferase [Alphaproteobacteria bacterium]